MVTKGKSHKSTFIHTRFSSFGLATGTGESSFLEMSDETMSRCFSMSEDDEVGDFSMVLQAGARVTGRRWGRNQGKEGLRGGSEIEPSPIGTKVI